MPERIAHIFYRLIFVLLCSGPLAAQQVPPVVMVSFDGFRADYAQRWQLPHFQQLAQQGVAAEGLVPVYPSKTFPNHYTLVTGMYPGSHGLVDNNFYAPELARHYRLGDSASVTDAAFYGGVALWQHAQEHGLRSASYFWVGSEAPLRGQYPDIYLPYDGSADNAGRVSTVLQWLQLPANERPQLITLYFSLVDSAAHDHGPLSAQAREAALEADRLLGLLLDGIAARNLAVNLLVVSDHGMVEVSAGRDSAIGMNTLGLPRDEVVVVNDQTQVLLYERRPGALDAWLQSSAARSADFTAYRKSETPEHWHYREHPHSGDVILAAAPGKIFVPLPALLPEHTDKVIGVHGYDATHRPDLYGIFYAMGPDLRTDLALGTIDNLEVAPLVAKLLRLPPLPTAESNAPTLSRLLRAAAE